MQEQEPKKLTMDDVAKALGVSKTTVSRAVSGKGRIGETTRQRVLEYIATIIPKIIQVNQLIQQTQMRAAHPDNRNRILLIAIVI